MDAQPSIRGLQRSATAAKRAAMQFASQKHGGACNQGAFLAAVVSITVKMQYFFPFPRWQVALANLSDFMVTLGFHQLVQSNAELGLGFIQEVTRRAMQREKGVAETSRKQERRSSSGSPSSTTQNSARG